MGPSIEETLENALKKLGLATSQLQAASRTDAGVHARGQVINFMNEESDIKKVERGLNALLPEDIAILNAEIAHDAFHPTLDAKGKEYCYEICYGNVQQPFHRYTSWHVPHTLSIPAMQEAAKKLIGTHDFSAFCNERSLLKGESVRTLYAIEFSLLEGERLRIALRGNHFLYKMVRNLVGTLIRVGQNKLLPKEVAEILQSKDRRSAGVTAPAHGLCLNKVFYDDIAQ